MDETTQTENLTSQDILQQTVPQPDQQIEGEKPSFDETLKAFKKDYDALLFTYNLEEKPDMDFPQYRQLPLEVQLAILILKKHGGVYVKRFFRKEAKEAHADQK